MTKDELLRYVAHIVVAFQCPFVMC